MKKYYTREEVKEIIVETIHKFHPPSNDNIPDHELKDNESKRISRSMLSLHGDPETHEEWHSHHFGHAHVYENASDIAHEKGMHELSQHYAEIAEAHREASTTQHEAREADHENYNAAYHTNLDDDERKELNDNYKHISQIAHEDTEHAEETTKHFHNLIKKNKFLHKAHNQVFPKAIAQSNEEFGNDNYKPHKYSGHSNIGLTYVE